MFNSQNPFMSFVQYTLKITAEMLSVVLILINILGCQAQHQDFKSVADYVDNLTHDDSSGNVLVLLGDGQYDLADNVLKKIMDGQRISMTIANFHYPISKTFHQQLHINNSNISSRINEFS